MYFAQQTFALPSAEDVPLEANLQERQARNGTGPGVLVPITFSRMDGNEDERQARNGTNPGVLVPITFSRQTKNELDSVDGFEAQENASNFQGNEESLENAESDQTERISKTWCRTIAKILGRECKYCLTCYPYIESWRIKVRCYGRIICS